MADSEKKILRLTCPLCQTRLRVAEDITRFSCLNCGNELDVVMEEGEAMLQPSASTKAQLSPTELELSRVKQALKEKDDSYGVGCAVATLGITLVSCVTILLSNVFQIGALFWITLVAALVVLLVVLVLFIVSSRNGTAPLIRQRDRLQAQLEREQANLDGQEMA